MPVSLSLFLILFTWVLLSIALGLKFYEWWRKAKMAAMLRTAAEDPAPGESELLRDMAAKRPPLEQWLEHLSLLEKTKRLIQQAGVSWTPGGMLIMMAGGAVAAVMLSLFLPRVVSRAEISAPLAILLASLPYLILRSKRTRRMAAFEEQFPEALDFLARSMRGARLHYQPAHGERRPTGSAWRGVPHTIQRAEPGGSPGYGALQPGNPDAAAGCAFLPVRGHLTEADRRKFGRDPHPPGTGIRERFKLKGQVKAASAHGRVTALVLTILPAATAILMMV